MLGFLKGDPKRKLQKDYEKKLTEAMQAQRNGDIRTYSVLSQEAEAMYARLQEMEKQA
ncbi:DUF6435 family protein [Marinobacter salicampi]|uniref:DUF6435 family protein n=1 Tax=Marinobacter salicampi TaxID=435907 RepID=UPI00140AB41C|nr:DUF6435 family protein [Marinobacter salicampi]